LAFLAAAKAGVLKTKAVAATEPRTDDQRIDRVRGVVMGCLSNAKGFQASSVGFNDHLTVRVPESGRSVELAPT
jgi:hypothetical protein